MGWSLRTVRIGLIVGVVAAGASTVGAQEKITPVAGPAMRTIKCIECVPEQYQEKRTCYRIECREETYDTFRCETVCEPRERVCTVTKKIHEYRTETVKVCCHKWCCEDKVVMKKCYEYRTVTCMQKKCVCKGHYECKAVCKQPGCLEKLCNPCACPRVVCKKCWVHCPEYIECPVTKCVKVCVQKPEICKVKVCKPYYVEKQVQRCHYRCVQEQHTEKYTEVVCRKVACKATRMVRVCVPYEETVTCCRMVASEVERQVPVDPCCNAACGCCQTTCCCPCRCQPCCDGCRTRHHGCH
ncbi:MAG: hypothetical protein FJ271_11600 [Planctomycetes bacterium]|nr:hypothetical protein [Planctomycetota bacterium]